MDIEEDVLMAAMELARYEKTTTGKIISRLARKGLENNSPGRPNITYRNGVPVLPQRDEIITNEMVEKIREEDGI